jgi:3'-phosphoadenosine 5'-phosphosulfate (PAPS) 3'-phosphatase
MAPKGSFDAANYAVALALIEDGRVVIGILGCPHLSLRGGSIDRRPCDSGEPGLAIQKTFSVR